MPAAFLSGDRLDAAVILRAQGWSLRRIASTLGCDHQQVHRAVNPQVKARWLAYMVDYHQADKVRRNRRTYALRQAREQAQEENVPVEVICERWQIEPPRNRVSR